MAYKRKRTTATTRRRVRRRTTMRVPRVPSGVPSTSMFKLKCKSFLYNWTFSSASTTGFWKYLSLNPTLLNSFNEHAQIFDEYKITGFQYEFRPNYDSFDVASTGSLGTFHTALDPCSTTAPNGVYGALTLNNFFEQSQNVRSHPADKVVRIYVKPKIASQVYGGGTNGRLINAPWLKTSDNFVDHRGFHAYMQQFNFAGSTLISYDVYVTIYCMFRGNK